MSSQDQLYGYAGKLLRVDLTKREVNIEDIDEKKLKHHVGGASLGVRYLFDEVSENVQWDDPENRIFYGGGPLTGTKMRGSGWVAVVSVGALTNGMASSQAGGFFGAFMRGCGYDAIIVQGAASEWSYLHIKKDGVEIKDASPFAGKDTVETEFILKEELCKKHRASSVLCIGPAGENLVKFACMSIDMGHMAAHNGLGAVMGSKKLKAIVIDRAQIPFPLKDKAALNELVKHVDANVIPQSPFQKEGTVGGIIHAMATKVLPVRNYQTGIFSISKEKLSDYDYPAIRKHFNAKPTPCWSCTATHCHVYEVPDGEYKGMIMEEPEYEGMAAMGSITGITDMPTSVTLNGLVDRYGMDVNETGYLLGFVMECYDKMILAKDDLDGLDMTWGNGKAVAALMRKIANREGVGDMLAEGVKNIAQKIGGEAVKIGVYTMKGNSPRCHDHRCVWFELFDTCVSNLGTIEAHGGSVPWDLLDLPAVYDRFDNLEIARRVARGKGAMLVDDSVVTCRFQTMCRIDVIVNAVNAVTGWDMNVTDAMDWGKRAVHLARLFNIKRGIDAKLDAPSPRYGSTPLDSVAAGKSIVSCWDEMLKTYYGEMGWDILTGIPLAETLHNFDMDYAVPYLHTDEKQ